MISNKLLGLICIVGGVVLFALLSWGCILQVAAALFSLSLINYGLYLQGFPQIQLSLRVLIELFRD